MINNVNYFLVATSLLFTLPCYIAIVYENYISAAAWGLLVCTSTLVHVTKEPFDLNKPNNCNPWLHSLDIFVLYMCIISSIVDSFYGGIVAILLVCVIILYSSTVFYYGQYSNKFVYAKDPEMSILSHMSVHLLGIFGAVAVLTLRQLNSKN